MKANSESTKRKSSTSALWCAALISLVGCQDGVFVPINGGQDAIPMLDSSNFDSGLQESLRADGSSEVDAEGRGSAIPTDAAPDKAQEELRLACRTACIVSTQISCSRTPTFEACESACLQASAVCYDAAIAYVRCLAALSVSDFECHPGFLSPTAVRGRCDQQAADVGTCRRMLL